MILIFQEEVARGETGFNSQNIGRGASETVGGPPLDFVPEGKELSCHVGSLFESIRAVTEDGKQKRGGQMVAQEGRQALSRRGEAFDGHKGPLGLGQSLGEVGCGGD